MLETGCEKKRTLFGEKFKELNEEKVNTMEDVFFVCLNIEMCFEWKDTLWIVKVYNVKQVCSVSLKVF